MITAWKLFRVKANGALTSLFINKHVELPIGKWLTARPHKTEGFAFRPGWHAPARRKRAPHLSMRGRVWRKVALKGVTELKKPEAQGGRWLLAKQMKIL